MDDSKNAPALDSIDDLRALLEGLFEHSPVAFQIYRADGHSLRVNPAFRQLFESEPPPDYNIFKDEIATKRGVADLIRRAFAGETISVPPFWYDPRELEHVQVTEGRRVAIEFTMFPLFDAGRTIRHVAICFKDVTGEVLRREERDELEEKVSERTAALALANRELEAFSYSVAHDLRAPLRGISGFSSVLLEDYADKLDAEGKRVLQRVVDGAERMGQLIDALLSLSRLTRMEIRFEPVDLTELARSVMEQMRTNEPERVVDFVAAEALTTTGDPQLLRVLLENLLGNAWKFTGKKSEARIEFGREEASGASVYFVRDNGAGFDMAYVDKLFAPFSRLHRISDFEGTGVGLATVMRIVRRHGGRAWAEGSLNHGTTVRFTLSGDAAPAGRGSSG